MNIAIVDDDKLVVEALSTILDNQSGITVVGSAFDGEGACEIYSRCHPDILLLDVRMRPKDGIVAGREILEDDPSARIVYLTTFADKEYVVHALRLGARGYLIKEQAALIAPALRRVLDGDIVLGEEVMERFPRFRAGVPSIEQPSAHTARNAGAGRKNPLLELTARESRIVELIADGSDNRTIAHTLFMSEGTVRNHISDILAKLGLKNRTQIAIQYWKFRLELREAISP